MKDNSAPEGAAAAPRRAPMPCMGVAAAYGQTTSGFQSAMIPDGLCFQTQAWCV
jgi:hypothetical protein